MAIRLALMVSFSMSDRFETAPSVYGMELDATTDEEDPGVADSEDDQNADSSEELDQMMVINGLYGDSDDSEDGGNTTDTLDDADDDGLARFGIETDEVHVPHDEHKELEDTADGLTRPVTRKQSKKAVNGESLPPPGPSMGDFNLPEPSPFGRKTMTVLDGSQQGPILSPFSVTKVRRRNKRTRVRTFDLNSMSILTRPCLLLPVMQRKCYTRTAHPTILIHLIAVNHVCSLYRPESTLTTFRYLGRRRSCLDAVGPGRHSRSVNSWRRRG